MQKNRYCKCKMVLNLLFITCSTSSIIIFQNRIVIDIVDFTSILQTNHIFLKEREWKFNDYDQLPPTPVYIFRRTALLCFLEKISFLEQKSKNVLNLTRFDLRKVKSWQIGNRFSSLKIRRVALKVRRSALYFYVTLCCFSKWYFTRDCATWSCSTPLRNTSLSKPSTARHSGHSFFKDFCICSVKQSTWNWWLHAVVRSTESKLIGARQMEQSSFIFLVLLDTPHRGWSEKECLWVCQRTERNEEMRTRWKRRVFYCSTLAIDD